MPNRCALLDCPNRHDKQKRPDLMLHGFPANENKKTEWMRWASMINGKKLDVGSGTRLCSDHFHKSLYSAHGRLIQSAVPSLWMGSENTLTESVFTYEKVANSTVVREEIVRVCNCPCFCGARQPKELSETQEKADPLYIPLLKRPSFSLTLPKNSVLPTADVNLSDVDCSSATASKDNLESEILLESHLNEKTSPRHSPMESCDSDDLTTLATPTIPERQLSIRFIKSLSAINFSTPRRAKQNVEIIQNVVCCTQKKLWYQKKQVRILRAKLKTLDDIVQHLKRDKNMKDSLAVSHPKVRKFPKSSSAGVTLDQK